MLVREQRRQTDRQTDRHNSVDRVDRIVSVNSE
jgi:hypothetical protein